jgi:serine/threonine protein kinase
MIKRQKRSLSLAMVARWSKDMLDGVVYLHRIHVMHRDLKPSNMLIFKDGTLKLGDFGLSREAAPSEAVKVQRETCTLWYRAPELIMGDLTYNSKIDVWSAGCIVLEMLVGRCATAGRVEDVCRCQKPTHYNYNEDQLTKIFRLVGTPTENKLLSRMACYKHFESWPHYHRSLEDTIKNACSATRLTAEPTYEDEMQARELARQWIDCVGSMLVIDPAQRPPAAEVLTAEIWKTGLPGPAALEAGNTLSRTPGASSSHKHTGSFLRRKTDRRPKLAIPRKKSQANGVAPQQLQPECLALQKQVEGLSFEGNRSSSKDDVYLPRAPSGNLPPLVRKGNTPPEGPLDEQPKQTAGLWPEASDLGRPTTRREERPPTRSRHDRRPSTRDRGSERPGTRGSMAPGHSATSIVRVNSADAISMGARSRRHDLSSVSLAHLQDRSQGPRP